MRTLWGAVIAGGKFLLVAVETRITVLVVLPLVEALGYDPIGFGVFMLRMALLFLVFLQLVLWVPQSM